MLIIHKSIKRKPASLPDYSFFCRVESWRAYCITPSSVVKDSVNCLGLPSNFPFGVTTLKALLDSPAAVAPPERGAPDSLSSFRSPALEEATLAGRTRPVAGELEGGGSCRDLTVMLKSRGIGAGIDTSIALIRVQIAKGNSFLCSDYHIIFNYLRLRNSSTIIRLL